MTSRKPLWILGLGLAVALLDGPGSRPGLRADEPTAAAEARRPADDADLKFWLGVMRVEHRFDVAEVSAATGLTAAEVEAATKRLGIDPSARAPSRTPDGALRVLPYPGGRHPRIGFLDGAVNPQRETKFSVFTPWDPASYVVVDLPEAVWSNLGLTYLAHTHVPTIWSKQGVTLPRQEWSRKPGGVLEATRTLPNGIRFSARVTPRNDSVRMSLRLTNGTPATLSDLRVQMCVMLKGARGFTDQSNANKILAPPYAVCRSADAKRWIITAWSPCHRAWANPPCPCLHSDPKFPDCPPGETREVRGWLSFYEGDDLAGELKRIDALGWPTARD